MMICIALSCMIGLMQHACSRAEPAVCLARGSGRRRVPCRLSGERRPGAARRRLRCELGSSVELEVDGSAAQRRRCRLH